MFLNFAIKKVNSCYLNIILLFRSRNQEPELVLKFAWSQSWSRKIKKGSTPATLVLFIIYRYFSTWTSKPSFLPIYWSFALFAFKTIRYQYALPFLKVSCGGTLHHSLQEYMLHLKRQHHEDVKVKCMCL